MKLHLLLLFLCLMYNSYSQSISGITRITTRAGESIAPQPSALSERYKFKCEMVDDVMYILYAKEFVNGKRVPDDFERVCSTTFKKGSRFSWEVIPDLSNMQYLKLFMYFPGMISMRDKYTDMSKCFKYLLYEEGTQHSKVNTEIPILFIYEDEIANPKTENELRPFLTQERKIPFHNDSIIRSKTERFILVYYNLKEMNE